MIALDHRFTVDLFREDGSHAGGAPLDVDWEPAVEATWFAGLRRGLVDPAQLGRGRAEVAPRWHDEHGAPYLAGFRVAIHTPEGARVEESFPREYFERQTRPAARALVDGGSLEAGAGYLYTVAAFPTEGGEGVSDDPAAEAAAAPLPLASGRWREVAGAAEAVGPAPRHDELRVVVPRTVLDEAEAATRACPGRETGGILIGHLHLDSEDGELFAEVTAQVPARHTTSDATRLSFQPETWTDVRAAVALRGRDEIWLGWWHSHVIYEWACAKCPPERQQSCSLAAGFLSEHDLVLHRTIFGRAWNLALVATHTATDDVRHALFGWRQGRVEARGFHRSTS